MQINADLIDDLAKQKVVLFLGSGVSASAKTVAGVGLKQWEPFLRHCAAELGEPNNELVNRLLNDKDYLLACEVLRRRLDTRWPDLLQQEFAQIAEPSPLHLALAGLDQRIIITTNFDKLIEVAWEKASSGATHYPQVSTRVTPETFRVLRDDRRHIIKLHGTIDDPESFIFTKAEYIEKAFGSWVYSEFLSVLLLTHTFLFVGFSMNDPAVSWLVEMNARRFPNSRPHYILQASPVNADLVDINKSLRRLYVLEYDPANDHAAAVDMISRP